MKQHKWHKEIKAWADGEQVEYRSEHLLKEGKVVWSEWADVGDINKIPAFYSDDDFEYRIKPTPKEPQYLYVYYDTNEDEIKVEVIECGEGYQYIGKIKLEVDDD